MYGRSLRSASGASAGASVARHRRGAASGQWLCPDEYHCDGCDAGNGRYTGERLLACACRGEMGLPVHHCAEAGAGETDCRQKPESGSIPALTAGGRRENHDPPLWRQWQYVAYRSKSDYAGGVERGKCSILKRIEIKKSWGPPSASRTTGISVSGKT